MDVHFLPSASRSLPAYLHARSLRLTNWKQWAIHASRHLPARIQNAIRKTLWPAGLKHMRYVLPSVSIKPEGGGVWTVRLRDKKTTTLVSRPLTQLRGFTDRPAILIATGPTARDFDWASLTDGKRLIWAVNGAPRLLQEQGLKCDFLVITDARFARDGADYIEAAAGQGAALMFSYDAAAGFAATRPHVMSQTPFHVFEKVNAWFGLPVLSAARLVRMNKASGEPFALPQEIVPGVGWSRDPELGVFAGKTVTFAALQLIVWSGSSQIEIVGLDLGGKARAYEEKDPVVSHLAKDYHAYILPSFQCMAAALANRPICMTNHSATSPLPRHLISEMTP